MASSHVAALGAVCCLLACGESPSASTNGPEATNNPAGGVPGATGDPALDACVQPRVDALNAVWNMAGRYATVCAADGDCAMVDASLPCQDGCRSAVLAAKLAAFESERTQYATSVCPTLPTNCGLAPSCAEMTPRCTNGVCRAVLGQEGR
jgi:hypothetical protein